MKWFHAILVFIVILCLNQLMLGLIWFYCSGWYFGSKVWVPEVLIYSVCLPVY